MFLRNKNECPIDPAMAQWLETTFNQLVQEFGMEQLLHKKVLCPTPQDFPLTYDGSTASLAATSDIVARQMDIDPELILLQLYSQNIQEFNSGYGNPIFTQVDTRKENNMSAGLYFGRNEQGKYEIMIEQQGLHRPEALVATLSHEFAHIKLLGEDREITDNEHATDLCTVIFGLGVFNANTAFTDSRSFMGYSYNNMGYLKQREWGYALALYAMFRGEDNPDWAKYLGPNLRSDIKKSIRYLKSQS